MTQHASTLKALTERLQELQARVSHIDAEMHQLLPADFEEQAADLESQDSLQGIEKATLHEIARSSMPSTVFITANTGCAANAANRLPSRA